MNEEKLKKFYENGAKHFSLPDFETFKTDMQDDAKLERYITSMSKHYNVASKDVVKEDLFGETEVIEEVKVEEVEKPSPVVEAAPARGLTEQAAESMLREDLEITDLVSEDGSLELPTDEWEPKYASEYYLSNQATQGEKFKFQEWKKKKTRKATGEEIELAKDKEDILKPPTILEQQGLNLGNIYEPTRFQKDIESAVFIDGIKNLSNNKTFVKPKDLVSEAEIEAINEEEMSYADVALIGFKSEDELKNLTPKQLDEVVSKLPYAAQMMGLEAVGEVLEPVSDAFTWLLDKAVLRTVGKEQTLGLEEIDTEFEVGTVDLRLENKTKTKFADAINKKLNEKNNPLNFYMIDGEVVPMVDRDAGQVTVKDVKEAIKTRIDFQRELEYSGFSEDEKKVIDINKEIRIAEANGEVEKLKTLNKELVDARSKIGASNKIFAEDGSVINKANATQADLANNAKIITEAEEMYAITDEAQMLKEKQLLAEKLLVLSDYVVQDPRVISRGMGFLQKMGDAIQEDQLKGSFGTTKDKGYFGITREDDLLLSVDMDILKGMVENNTVDPSISNLPGNSNLAQKFNEVLNQYNVVTKAIELNIDPTTGVDTGERDGFFEWFIPNMDNAATLGTGFANLITTTGSQTQRDEARDFINFAQNQVGITLSEDQNKMLDVGIGEMTAEGLPGLFQVIGEFYLARKIIGPQRIKKLGDTIRALGATKPKVLRRATNISASIITEAVAIQARNSLVAPVVGSEDMDLTWAVGAGAMSSFAKYFSPAAAEGIWTTGNKTVNRLITTIGNSETAKAISSQVIQPAVGTGVMIAGEITENLLTTNKGFGEIMEEATDWEKLVSTWSMLWALKNSKAPLNIVREPYRAVEADLLRLGKKTRFTREAAKTLGVDKNYMDKGEDGEYLVTSDELSFAKKNKRSEIIKDKNLSPKEKNKKLQEINDAFNTMNNHRQYLDIKKAIKSQEGGKQMWADQYVESMNLAYGKTLNAKNIEGLANTPSLELTKLMLQDPYNPLSKQNNNALSSYIYNQRKLAQDLSMEANLLVASQGGLRGKARTKFFDERLKQIRAEQAINVLNKNKAKVGDVVYEKTKAELEEIVSKSNTAVEKLSEDYTTSLKESGKFEKISKPIIQRAKEAGFEIIEDKTLGYEAEIGGGKLKYNPEKAPEFFTLGVHEVGHPVIDRMFEGKTQAEKNKFVADFKAVLPEKTFKLIEQRLKTRQNVQDYKNNKNTVEWLNIFLDLTSSGALKYEGSLFDKVGDFLKKNQKGKGYSLDLNFESPKEVYDNLKAFAERAGEGKAGEGLAGRQLVESLKKSLEASKKSGVQKSVVTPEGKPIEKIEDLDKLNWKKYKTKAEFQNSKEFERAYNFIYSPQMESLILSNFRQDLKTADNLYEAQAEITKLLMRFDPVEQFKLPADKQSLAAYMGGNLLKFKIGTAANIGEKRGSGKTVSVDKTMGDGKTTFAETLETKDDIEGAIDKKAEPKKPVKEVSTATKVGMPKVIKQKVGGKFVEKSADDYIEEIAEGINYEKLPNINEPAGPNQTISPFLSKLGAQIANSKLIKADVSQSMGRAKERVEYLSNNFKNIVENLDPSYFSGLMERRIKSGKEPLLPEGLIQKDIGQGYTSNWYGKKAVGVKSAKTGITSGLKRIRINPNFDFKNKVNIEAFQNAFKSQGRYEGLGSKIAAKGVIDYVQKSLGTGNKLDLKLQEQYGADTKKLVQELKSQIAKANYQRSQTEEGIQKAREEIRKKITPRSFVGEMQGMATWIKGFAKDMDIAIAKEIGADGNVRDLIGQQRLSDFASKVLSKYFGESILSGQTWSNTKLGKGMWFSTDFRNKVLKEFRKEQKGKTPLTTKEYNALKLLMGSPGLDPMKTNPFGGKQSGKWKDKVDTNYEGLDLFIDKTFKMLKENPEYLGEFLAMMKGSSSSNSHFWRNASQVVGKHRNWADKAMINPKKKGVGVGEHALVQNQAGEFMTKAILESIARDNPKAKNIAKKLLNENYFQILISHGLDGKLTQIGLQSSMPKGFWESWNKALETGNINEAWSVWSRYFNEKINKIKGADGEFGFDPNKIDLLNRKTGEVESLADTLKIGEKEFGKDVLNPEIIAKQQELIQKWSTRQEGFTKPEQLREKLAIELDMLNAKRDATLKTMKDIAEVKDPIFNMSERMPNKTLVDEANKFDKALANARKIKKEVKKARVFDFDDTIARTNSKVFAEKAGERIELTAEEFAARGDILIGEGYKMDFSDFNKVVDGKKGPLFDVMKKMKEASGDRDMFILTARAPESAPAIKQFLDAMGINIPLKNITGLGNSAGKAKADWLVGKAAEGYNDFYFADDAAQNVKAVRDALEVLDVKSKTQQAKIQRSETLSGDFNKLLEESKGVGREKIFSDVKAELRGAKARRQKFFIPPSAEDFMGLLYPTLGKGKQGEAHLKFYKESLFDPYSRAMENLSTDRVNLMADFKELKKQLDVPKDLRKETESGFTNEQAVRTYLWAKTGREIPGLSKSDFKELNDIVEGDAKLKAFAEQILSITKGDGYSKPGKNWAAGTITTDLMELLNTTKRSKYLETWQQNADLIFSKDNMNKLEAVFGKKYRESLESALSRMKAGTNRIQGGNKLSNQVLDYINNSTGVVMFLNMRSAVLQTISAANFVNWSFNNPLKAGKAFANQPQYWADFKELMNSDYLKDRRNGLKLNINESEIANAAKTSKNKAKAVISYIIEKGYTPTKFADSFAIATGGATFYRNRINDLMKNEGKTEAEAKKQAMEEFRKVSELSQQSSDPSKISRQQSGDLGRMILQYVNTPMQYARLQKRDIQDIANKRRIEGKTLAQSNRTRLSRIAYYGFIQNLMFNALQQGLFALGMGDGEIDPDEEKTLFKSANGMLDSSLRGLGLAGVTVQVLKNLVMDVYDRSQRDRPEYVDAWQKLLDFSPAIKSKMSKFKGAAYPFDSKKRRAEVFDKGFSLDNPAYESMAKVISATTNIPLDRLYTKVENVKHAFDDNNEAWQSVAMLLGWPSWQIRNKNKSTKAKFVIDNTMSDNEVEFLPYNENSEMQYEEVEILPYNE